MRALKAADCPRGTLRDFHPLAICLPALPYAGDRPLAIRAPPVAQGVPQHVESQAADQQRAAGGAPRVVAAKASIMPAIEELKRDPAHTNAILHLTC